MPRELPMLPVVVPLAGLILMLLLAHLRRRGLLTLPRAAVALALCIYVAGVVANTVFPVYLDVPADRPPWRVYFAPLEYETADAVMNIVVFAPLGVLVALLLPRVSAIRVVAVAAALSLTIEATQLVTGHYLRGGHVADGSDLLFNVVGAAIGYGCYAVLARMPRTAGLVTAFRWQ